MQWRDDITLWACGLWLLSAIASSLSGTSRPSAFAVLRLMTSSYLVGACTGKFSRLEPSTVHACHLGEALATSLGHTVTSSLLRHWTMTGTASALRPV